MIDNELQKRILRLEEALEEAYNACLSLDQPTEGHGGYLDAIQGKVEEAFSCLEMGKHLLNKKRA